MQSYEELSIYTNFTHNTAIHIYKAIYFSLRSYKEALLFFIFSASNITCVLDSLIPSSSALDSAQTIVSISFSDCSSKVNAKQVFWLNPKFLQPASYDLET